MAVAFSGSANLTNPKSSLLGTTTRLPLSPPFLSFHVNRRPNAAIVASVSASSSPSTGQTQWSLNSWMSKTAHQLPEYPDAVERDSVLKTIGSFPPIVFAGEARKLEEKLSNAAVGKAFLLQGGDCAESFKEFNGTNIRDTFRVLLQMGIVLTFGAQMPVITGCRMAGQFAKPMSDPFEIKDGVKLPSYRGDNVNAFATGGYAAMQRVSQWNLDFVKHSEQGDRYMELAQRVDEALGFMAAAGIAIDDPQMNTVDFWTSHECLHLPYEKALTREDSTTSLYYDCSAHLLWGCPPGWAYCYLVGDPMHGNTIKAPCGLKTRPFDAIRAELRAFFDVHEQEGSYPGGVHLEMTGQNVTECIGGSNTVTFDDLNSRYHTHFDPRLNASQSLELAFAISERLRKRRL
ncbi:Phospho-2-dehydro-3-deoxyheptonate aldolase 1 [Hibiscus syriacus]|uniref:Phospho-2-dehydro-3-deoxyheptonate aldolase n=1 Tax=Hibiscus syriacus TaxID=106335 RepID=A0A6A2XM19_HIBSY|nr:Phospho-2-dehydro-3-deoxyheptonate aldolase 1 [Hibiscus syriacus]